MSNSNPHKTREQVEAERRQPIYDVLNIHDPHSCNDKPCKSVTAILALIDTAVAEARRDELAAIKNTYSPYNWNTNYYQPGIHPMSRLIDDRLHELTNQQPQQNTSKPKKER